MGEVVRGEGKGGRCVCVCVCVCWGGFYYNQQPPSRADDEIPRPSLSIVGYLKEPNTEGRKVW